MGRSVSYPSGAIVAFTVLEVEAEDDWEFEYEWLRDDLRERAGRAFSSLIPHDGWRGRASSMSSSGMSSLNGYPSWQLAQHSSWSAAPTSSTCASSVSGPLQRGHASTLLNSSESGMCTLYPGPGLRRSRRASSVVL